MSRPSAPAPATAPSSVQDAAIQRRTLRVLVAMQIIGTIGVGVAPSIGVLLAGEVTDSEAWAGLARTASTLGAALAGLPLGRLAARHGRRWALAGGWWVGGTGSAILVLAAQAGLTVPLFIGLLLIGAGSAVALQARFAATDLADPAHRGRSLALVVWVGTLGSVLGPNLGIPGGAVGELVGLNVYAGAFLIAAVCMLLAGFLVFALLRPDPLLRAAARGAGPAEVGAAPGPAGADAVPALDAPGPAPDAARPPARRGGRLRQLLAEARANGPARYAVTAILTAQIVMVAIMTMTPVHIAHHGGSITVVGLTISLHVAGMFALAPLVGLLADRFGHRAAVGGGVLILLASLLLAALRPDSTAGIVVSLILLGVGWSFVNVSASALFSAVITDRSRASSQGGIDALANLCGASAALAAGPLMAVSSFSVLSLLAILALVPLAVLTVRAPRRSASADRARPA
ncbi:MFS transporter [Brachybacterium phenoliresistens]